MNPTRLYRTVIGLALLAALAACRPGAAEYSEAEAPNRLMLDNASKYLDLRFVPGSARIVPYDAARLRAAMADGTLIPSDRVGVAVTGSPALAQARYDTLSAELLRKGIVINRLYLSDVAPNHAIVQSARYLVRLPRCPNWSKQGSLDFTNTLSSNFGCATAVNLGLSIANPADLAEGRPVGYADAIPAAAAVQRYQADKVVLPSSANLTSISAPATAAPGGGTGAGSAGASP